MMRVGCKGGETELLRSGRVVMAFGAFRAFGRIAWRDDMIP